MTAQAKAVKAPKKQTRPKRCYDCGKAFIRKASNQRRCPKCQEKREAEQRQERYYDPSPYASSECWGCAFLDDCRYKVRRGQAPYCWIENPRHYMFVERYLNSNGKDGSRVLIAKQLVSVAKRIKEPA